MEREQLELERSQALELLPYYSSGDGAPEFEIIENRQIGHGRWSLKYRIVIKRKSDGKYFADTYDIGATEMQEERPWECSKPNFTEVFPVEKVIIEYQ